MKKIDFDWKEYIALSRQVAAEGMVLLKNDNATLPAKKGESVALFGRTQFDYIRCGTGSGGLVNVPYVVNYYDGLKACKDISVYEPLSDIYRKWIEQNPFDKGHGWATEPTSQVEMPVTDEIVSDARKNAELALVFISRLAGEDKDCKAEKGDYYLTDGEVDLIKKVTARFERTAVLIDSGDIIDMNWVKEIGPSAVMYIWQGGCEGGNALADVISGRVNPSGKLAETIAADIKDYPSHANFGDPTRNFYQEDVYVGYRYFETFAPDKVLYPFGYGLSYTTFSIDASFSMDNAPFITATVTNTGSVSGRETVMVFMQSPQGMLGKPLRTLVGFNKTKLLKPGESETLTVNWTEREMASYDDTGATGFKNSFVMESGEYIFYTGANVRDINYTGSFNLSETTEIEKTSPALYPIREFERMVPDYQNDGFVPKYAPVPVREVSTEERILKMRDDIEDIPYTGDKGIKLKDVKEGRAEMKDFIAQLSDEELIVMSRGEGMSSRRVVPGTCAAYGGVLDSLQNYGIPAAACTDGPNGLRIDSGMMAFQVANGSCMAATFDPELLIKLFTCLGKELLRDKIDCILGPGMNIKRHPLNGRNFEYFSEDPLVTGRIAAAELTGMGKYNTTGCIKHFACNNQETNRYGSDAVVSARALREIYLRGYEIAIKEGHATHIMTTYGVLNGWHTAGSFELNTMVLRNDWGFKGVSMTDWWAVVGSEEDPEPNIRKTGYMVRAQNDLYMVTNSSEENANNDDAREALEKGLILRKELARNAENIVYTVMNTPAYDRLCGEEFEFNDIDRPSENVVMADVVFEHVVREGEGFDAGLLKTGRGNVNMITLRFPEKGDYRMHFEIAAEGSELSQMAVSFAVNNTVMKVITKNGTEREFVPEDVLLGHGYSTERFLKIAFTQEGLKIRNIVFKKDTQNTYQ